MNNLGHTGGWLRKKPALRALSPLAFDFWDELLEPLAALSDEKGKFSPKIDVKETDAELRVIAELPGLTKDQVTIDITDEAIVLKGEKSEEHEEKDAKNVRRYVERSYGSFQRVIPLNSEVDHEKADASFKNGVLTIKLPKTNKENKVKKLSIRSE